MHPCFHGHELFEAGIFATGLSLVLAFRNGLVSLSNGRRCSPAGELERDLAAAAGGGVD